MFTKLKALFGRPSTMTAVEAARAIADGAVLVDVRQPDEWRAGHAPAARHIALRQLGNRLHEIPADRPVITVCRSGHRSAMAANILDRRGYTATNLAGGMTAWATAGLPVVTDTDQPGHVA